MKTIFSPDPYAALANVLIFLLLMIGFLVALMVIFSFDLSDQMQSVFIIPLLAIYSYFLLSWPRRSPTYRWPVLICWVAFWLIGVGQNLPFLSANITLPLGTLSMLGAIVAYVMRFLALPERTWVHWAKSSGVLYLLGLVEVFILSTWLQLLAPDFWLTLILTDLFQSISDWLVPAIVIPLVFTTLCHLVDLRFFPRDYRYRPEDYELLLEEMGGGEA
jgi:hypothetical protein